MQILKSSQRCSALIPPQIINPSLRNKLRLQVRGGKGKALSNMRSKAELEAAKKFFFKRVQRRVFTILMIPIRHDE